MKCEHCGRWINGARKHVVMWRDRKQRSCRSCAQAYYRLDGASPSQDGCYIYFALCNGRTKIGRAKAPKHRLSHATPPWPIKIIHQYYTLTPGRDERNWHFDLAWYRRHGEWFDLPESVIEQVHSVNQFTHLALPGVRYRAGTTRQYHTGEFVPAWDASWMTSGVLDNIFIRKAFHRKIDTTQHLSPSHAIRLCADTSAFSAFSPEKKWRHLCEHSLENEIAQAIKGIKMCEEMLCGAK